MKNEVFWQCFGPLCDKVQISPQSLIKSGVEDSRPCVGHA